MSRFASSLMITGEISSESNMTASIYGDVQVIGYAPDCKCESTVAPLVALQIFLEFLQTLYTAVDNFYVTIDINSPLVAFMSVTGAIRFSVYVRLTWGRLNPDIQFNPDSLTDINALKDIYLSYNRDWRSDNFLVTKTFELQTGV